MNLIISERTYDWIPYCTGMVLKDPKKFNVLIIRTDDDVPIYHFQNLCEEAVGIQRFKDLMSICSYLDVNKVQNLNIDDINQVILRPVITLKILTEDVNTIYIDNRNTIFNMVLDVVKSISKNITVYSFGEADNTKERKVVKVSDSDMIKKVNTFHYMVACPVLNKINVFTDTEIFYKVEG